MEGQLAIGTREAVKNSIEGIFKEVGFSSIIDEQSSKEGLSFSVLTEVGTFSLLVVGPFEIRIDWSGMRGARACSKIIIERMNRCGYVLQEHSTTLSDYGNLRKCLALLKEISKL